MRSFFAFVINVFYFCFAHCQIEGFHYNRVGITEIVMDVLSHNISRKSHDVEFLSTHLPENRRHVLKRASVIRQQGLESTDIFTRDLWDKYLDRPSGTLFDGLTYMEFYTHFRQIFGIQQSRQVHMGPYDEEVVHQDWIYVDDDNRQYVYRDQECVIRHRATPLTSVDEACIHLLMLNWPTRVDCDRWLDETGAASFYELAVRVLEENILRTIQGGLGVNVQEMEDMEQVVVLNEQQQELLDMILNDPGLYCIQGAAGTGKSVLLRAIRRRLREQGHYEPIVLALSGVAAASVRGQTIHRFFGAGQPKGTSSGRRLFVPNLFTLEWNMHRIRADGREPFFLIDEMSMIPASMYEGMSNALKGLATGANMMLPFGGAPVVVFGDFGQLGPIVDVAEEEGEWFWNGADFGAFGQYELAEPCRQDEDNEFFKVLSVIRRGPSTDEEYALVLNTLESRNVRTRREDCVTLTALRDDAKAINEVYMARLSKPEDRHAVMAIDGIPASADSQHSQEYLENETSLLTKLEIWKGARVIVISNLDPEQGIINGTTAVVVGWDENAIFIRLSDEREVAVAREVRQTSSGGISRSQFPLQLSYAMTIHRSQSLTLPCVLVNLQGLFCPGQAYVALSRVKRLTDLHVVNIPEDLNSLFPPDYISEHIGNQ